MGPSSVLPPSFMYTLFCFFFWRVGRNMKINGVLLVSQRAQNTRFRRIFHTRRSRKQTVIVSRQRTEGRTGVPRRRLVERKKDDPEEGEKKKAHKREIFSRVWIGNVKREKKNKHLFATAERRARGKNGKLPFATCTIARVYNHRMKRKGESIGRE